MMIRHFSILLISLISCPLFAQEDNSQELFDKGIKKYEELRGIIQYEISGDATGSAIRTFDLHGWKEKFFTDVTIEKYGVTSIEKNTDLSLGDFIYSFKEGSEKGKVKRSGELSDLLSYKSNKESLAAIMEASGATIGESITILDREATCWTFIKGTTKQICVSNGIPLKITKKLPGISYEVIATSFSKDAIDTSFDLPNGIVWE